MDHFDHVVLILRDDRGEIAARYSRCQHDLEPHQRWNYFVTQVREAFDGDHELLAVVLDDLHEHPPVIAGGVALPTDAHMP